MKSYFRMIYVCLLIKFYAEKFLQYNNGVYGQQKKRNCGVSQHIFKDRNSSLQLKRMLQFHCAAHCQIQGISNKSVGWLNEMKRIQLSTQCNFGYITRDIAFYGNCIYHQMHLLIYVLITKCFQINLNNFAKRNKNSLFLSLLCISQPITSP